jgi:hypothetical protein
LDLWNSCSCTYKDHLETPYDAVTQFSSVTCTSSVLWMKQDSRGTICTTIHTCSLLICYSNTHILFCENICPMMLVYMKSEMVIHPVVSNYI